MRSICPNCQCSYSNLFYTYKVVNREFLKRHVVAKNYTYLLSKKVFFWPLYISNNSKKKNTTAVKVEKRHPITSEEKLLLDLYVAHTFWFFSPLQYHALSKYIHITDWNLAWTSGVLENWDLSVYRFFTSFKMHSYSLFL